MSQYGNYPITEEYKRQIRMEKLQKKVVQWAQDKGLLTDVTPERVEKQGLKVLEEIGETAGAFLKGNIDELIDGIGDSAVTIIILHRMRCGYIMNELDILSQPKEKPTLLKVASLVLNLGHNQAMEELHYFAESQGLKLEDCLQSAYDVISKRTGKMVNGTFVKDK